MAEVLALVDEAEADVVAFDPLQRMTGGLSQDKSNEMDAVLDIFSELQSRGQTVVYAHHNNKAGANVGSAYSMTGTQRFGSDADAVCSLYRPALALPDDNDAHIKQRNFTWTLRSGAADGRSVTLAPNTSDPSLVDVTFAPPISNIEELTNNAHEGMF